MDFSRFKQISKDIEKHNIKSEEDIIIKALIPGTSPAFLNHYINEMLQHSGLRYKAVNSEHIEFTW